MALAEVSGAFKVEFKNNSEVVNDFTLVLGGGWISFPISLKAACKEMIGQYVFVNFFRSVMLCS